MGMLDRKRDGFVEFVRAKIERERLASPGAQRCSVHFRARSNAQGMFEIPGIRVAQELR